MILEPELKKTVDKLEASIAERKYARGLRLSLEATDVNGNCFYSSKSAACYAQLKYSCKGKDVKEIRQYILLAGQHGKTPPEYGGVLPDKKDVLEWIRMVFEYCPVQGHQTPEEILEEGWVFYPRAEGASPSAFYVTGCLLRYLSEAPGQILLAKYLHEVGFNFWAALYFSQPRGGPGEGHALFPGTYTTGGMRTSRGTGAYDRPISILPSIRANWWSQDPTLCDTRHALKFFDGKLKKGGNWNQYSSANAVFGRHGPLVAEVTDCYDSLLTGLDEIYANPRKYRFAEAFLKEKFGDKMNISLGQLKKEKKNA